ncbi:hypothetical protein RvY_19219 [Ramazzottius varieornatus]|uniref:Protein quiver n=1 Tax=Ramazzottius varieornatus TaxID=947166 RepID=A0A1D1W8P1_RAMVA|nr:hypothetical protein RvY_19219 [Ramazzottius varieornatus]
MEFRPWMLFVCMSMTAKFRDVDAAKCYVCMGTDEENGLTEFHSCPNIYDKSSTKQVECYSSPNSKMGAHCLTFVGSQLWNPNALTPPPPARDGVLRLCLNDKVQTNLLGSQFADAVTEVMKAEECRASENLQNHPTQLDQKGGKIPTMRIRGLACACATDYCNNRYNASLLTYSASSKSFSSWTATLFLFTSVVLMQSN